MDFFLLPDKIKAQIPTAPPGAKEPEVLNSASSLDGASGECYLVATSEALYLFSKAFGADSYSCLIAAIDDSTFSMRVVKDKFNLRLEIQNSAWSHYLKFSNFDSAKLEQLAVNCMNGRQPAAPMSSSSSVSAAPPKAKAVPSAYQSQANAPQRASSVEVEPFTGLLAALMFVAKADDRVDPSEDAFIKNVASGDMEALRLAFSLHQTCEPLDLAKALLGLAHEDRLCIVANMRELAMVDGMLRSSEQRFISSFALAMGVSDDEYSTLRDVLLLKGRVALLKSKA